MHDTANVFFWSETASFWCICHFNCKCQPFGPTTFPTLNHGIHLREFFEETAFFCFFVVGGWQLSVSSISSWLSLLSNAFVSGFTWAAKLRRSSYFTVSVLKMVFSSSSLPISCHSLYSSSSKLFISPFHYRFIKENKFLFDVTFLNEFDSITTGLEFGLIVKQIFVGSPSFFGEVSGR